MLLRVLWQGTPTPLRQFLAEHDVGRFRHDKVPKQSKSGPAVKRHDVAEKL
jgi:hypothetical protein